MVCTVTICGGGVDSTLNFGNSVSVAPPMAKCKMTENVMNAVDNRASEYFSRFVKSGGTVRCAVAGPLGDVDT